MKRLLSLLLIGLILLLSACTPTPTGETAPVTTGEIPAYNGSPWVSIHGGVPQFTPEEITETAFERYSPLDALGRCGVAMASVGVEIMPTEDRGSIGQVKPSGWHTVKYDVVDGKYLYNRCHLLGYQLTGENANVENLITGTRYLNVQGMLPFENMVADYVKETKNHVMLRVTPVFHGEELVARGVIMEAYSVEDQGEGISFHVYCYNVQPSVYIDYATGESRLNPETNEETATGETYVLNTNTRKIHKPHCSSVASIREENRDTYSGSLSPLLEQDYTTCGNCFS